MSTLVVNTHEAKSRLSELIREAERGAEVIVARNGRPVARIVAWSDTRPTREPGAWKGQVAGGPELDGPDLDGPDLVGPDDDVQALFDESAS